MLVIVAGGIFIATCMFYPFLPGPYDGLAVTVSVMARLFGIVGLLLVPLGAAWLSYEIKSRSRREATECSRRGRQFARASLILSTLVATIVALGALVDHHLSVGVIAMVLWIYVVRRLASCTTARTNGARGTFNPAPIYLIVWPLMAAAGEFALMGPALQSSRNRAVDGSARMISDIERYRELHGHYPQSLESLWDDYRPSLVGIRRFHYEPTATAYNLYFEHFAAALDQKEIVMYNPRGEQDFSSHNRDLLELTPDQITAQRGHVAVRHTSRPHWTYFLFD